MPSAVNKETAQMREEERKQIVMDKLRKNQIHHESIANMREQERTLNKREKEAMTKKREYQVQLAKEGEIQMKEFLVNKFHEDEQKVAAIQAMKEKELTIIKEERELHLQMKRDNVERIKRMQEYKRVETMKKISENDKRTEEMMKTKGELAKTRQKNAVEAKIRRDKLMQILVKSKTSGGKAIKKILAQLENEEEMPTIVNKKKSFNSLDLSSSKSNRKMTNKSPSETKPPPIIEIIGPPPEAPSLIARMSNKIGQKEYISPYANFRNK